MRGGRGGDSVWTEKQLLSGDKLSSISERASSSFHVLVTKKLFLGGRGGTTLPGAQDQVRGDLRKEQHTHHHPVFSS